MQFLKLREKLNYFVSFAHVCDQWSPNEYSVA